MYEAESQIANRTTTSHCKEIRHHAVQLAINNNLIPSIHKTIPNPPPSLDKLRDSYGNIRWVSLLPPQKAYIFLPDVTISQPGAARKIPAFHIDAEQLTHQPPRTISKGWSDLTVNISLGTCIIAVSLHLNQVQGGTLLASTHINHFGHTPKGSQRYLGPRPGLILTPCHQVAT
eukprot:Em0005g362a